MAGWHWARLVVDSSADALDLDDAGVWVGIRKQLRKDLKIRQSYKPWGGKRR